MSKRILSCLTAVVLAFCLCIGVSAYELPYSIGVADEDFGSGGYYSGENGRLRKGFVEDFSFLTNTRPGTEYFMPLRVKDFEWEVDRGADRPLKLTPQISELLQLDLQVDFIDGDQAFDRVALEARGDEVGILIKFVESYPSIEVLEFKAEARLRSAGSRIEGADFLIEGTLSNRNRYVYSTTSALQLGVGRMATGYSDVYGVKFDLGKGVTLTGDILFGQTLYGAADDAVTKGDQDILGQYPQITKVLRLKTVELVGKVWLDTGDAGVMHVYNWDLTYLGTTSGPVRFERLYYLSATKLG